MACWCPLKAAEKMKNLLILVGLLHFCDVSFYKHHFFVVFENLILCIQCSYLSASVDSKLQFYVPMGKLTVV